MAGGDDTSARPVKALGPFAITSVVVGSVIGSGIFILPALMASQVPSPLLVIGAFVAGGLVSLFGALTLAELGGMFPREGGQYVFLRETVGGGTAFLYGWTAFWVVQTGIMAAVALAFGRFAGLVFGYDDAVTTAFAAVGAIAVLSVINYFGVRQGAFVQNILTIAKVSALLLLVVGGFLLADPDHNMFSPLLPDEPTGFSLLSLLGLAALTGIFAYDGWYYATYMAGEAKDPQRSIPKGLALGMLIIVTVYLLAVLAYFYVLPASEVAAVGADGNSRIAAAVAEEFLGGPGVIFVAVTVMVSTLGAVNGTILASPRLFHAIAEDGRFWHPFRKRHPKHATPHYAMWYQGIWGSLLVMASVPARDAYLLIVNSVVFAIWLFFVPTAWGYFRMRRREPERERPYRAWGHPVVPGVFLLAASAIVLNAVYTDVRLAVTDGVGWQQLSAMSSFWGLLLIATGLPFLWRGRGVDGAVGPTSPPR